MDTEEIKRYNRKDFIEVTYSKRAYDGKLEKIARIFDRDNSYVYTKRGQVYTIVPTRWITIDVIEN